MSNESLESWIQQQGDLIETFHSQGQRGSQDPELYTIPAERTNWIDEQRALMETSALGDLSHHMTAVRIEGPDALRLLRTLCVNDFDNFEIGQGKQIVMCSPDGYLIGDGPLLRLDENKFFSAGLHGTKWLKFNLEQGEYDVAVNIEPPTPLLPAGETPEKFIYQLQGPTTNDVLRQLTDDDFQDIGFFSFKEITLTGHEIIAFGHGMSPESGFELIGPYEQAEKIKDAIHDAGAEYGLRELGRKAYVAQSTKLGWVPPWPKPFYAGDEFVEYRRWVDSEKENKYGKAYWADEATLESSFSIEGSFASTDITDYYLCPVEIGYKKLINFEHEFIGKEALKEAVEQQDRTLVSLFWDPKDAKKVNDRLYDNGEIYKTFGDLPLIRRATMPYDEVRKDGELVGISHTRSYQWDIRGVVSLCRIDKEFSDPGTEVTVIWGEPDGTSPNPSIEDHVQTEISATVREAPYKQKAKADR